MRSAQTSLSRPKSRPIVTPLAFLIGVALCFSASLRAQDNSGVVDIVPASKQAPIATPAAPKPGDFSKEGLVFEKTHTEIRMETDGTGVREVTARVHVLADSGVKQLAVLTFPYTASTQQVDIGYIRVTKPDGTVVATPDYNIQDLPADVTRSAPMYSDIHEKHVAVRGLGVGDEIESKVTYRTVKPEVPGHFWLEYGFQKDLIVLDEQLDLDVPAAGAITVNSSDVQPTITTKDGRKLYHWASSNLARPDPDAPPKSTQHIKPSVQVTTFSSWQQVGAWYQSLQHDSLIVTPAIQTKVTTLTKGLTSDEEKVRAIFNDVALHIHYVGLEFGIGRYQPHPADDVLSNEYGDCKDKHTLLAAELKAIGIEAWPVLISANRELDPDTPSPAQFNHVITLVPLEGRLLWMDSTEEVAPVSVLLSPLRDKQALAIPTAKAAYLEHTPAQLPFPEANRFQSEGKITAEGKFSGHIVQSYHGDVEVLLRTVLRQVSQSQWKEALQRFSQGIGFGGEVSNPQISEIEQTAKPLELSYDYSREKFGEWDDHRISPALPPTGIALMPGIKEKKPADPVELGSPGELVYSSSIELPKGWTVILQENIALKEDWAEYKATYGFKDGVLTAERRVTVKQSQVPLDQWEKYLSFRHAIYADEVRTMSVFNGSGISGSPPSSTTGSGGYIPNYMAGALLLRPELRQQIMDVLEPAQTAEETLKADSPPAPDDLAKALTQARQAVDAVEAKTATLPPGNLESIYWMQGLSSAWSTLGWAALQSKDLATAENYLRAAWHLSEDRQSGFRLAKTLEAKGEKQSAAHQYELAHISSLSGTFGKPSFMDNDASQQLGDAYKRLTGHELKATALENGRYTGSLREELDKLVELRPAIKTTKLNGSAYFIFVFSPGKPTRASFLGGDKTLMSLLPAVVAHPFAAIQPTGSKAVLLREARVICTQWAGCDVDFLLPTSIAMPPVTITPQDRGKPVTLQVEPPIVHN
jgi:hypothetical protein